MLWRTFDKDAAHARFGSLKFSRFLSFWDILHQHSDIFVTYVYVYNIYTSCIRLDIYIYTYMWVAQTPTSSGLHLFVSFVLLPSSLEPNGGPYVLWYTSWFVQSLTATNHRSTRLTEWWMKWTGTFCLDDYHWFIQGPIDSDDLKCRNSHPLYSIFWMNLRSKWCHISYWHFPSGFGLRHRSETALN